MKTKITTPLAPGSGSAWYVVYNDESRSGKGTDGRGGVDLVLSAPLLPAFVHVLLLLFTQGQRMVLSVCFPHSDLVSKPPRTMWSVPFSQNASG